MFFRQLATKESSLSYLLGCAGHGKAVAVDVVAGDEDWFRGRGAHGQVGYHARDRHPCARGPSLGRAQRCRRRRAPSTVCTSQLRAVVKFPFEPLRDEQLIEAGNVLVACAAHARAHARERLAAGDRQAPRRGAVVRAHRRHAVRRRGRATGPARPRARDGWHAVRHAADASCCRCRTPRDLSRPPGRQRLRCRAVRQAVLDARLREALESGAFHPRPGASSSPILTRDIPPRPAEHGPDRRGEPRGMTRQVAA